MELRDLHRKKDFLVSGLIFGGVMGFRHLPLAVKDVKKLSEIKEIIDKEYLWAADDNALAIQPLPELYLRHG